MKIIVYLKKNESVISYGELWKTIKSKERKHLTPIEKAQKVVEELNDLLPNSCLKQKTMYYYLKEE